jgi:hypothetical protein
VADVGPQSVELSAGELEVGEQQSFDPFHMLGGEAQPGPDCLFFNAFDAMDSCQAVAFSQQGQTFQDRVLGMMPTIEDRADSFDKSFAACPTLIALSAGLGSSKEADVTAINLAILATMRIPAKGAGMHQPCWFLHKSSAC